MSRPRVRRYLLNPETAANLKNLFGGPSHAYRVLGITADIPLQEFTQALALDFAREDVIVRIEYQWRLWRQAFLKSTTVDEPVESVRQDRERGSYFAADALSPEGKRNGSAPSFNLPVLTLDQVQFQQFARERTWAQPMGEKFD